MLYLSTWQSLHLARTHKLALVVAYLTKRPYLHTFDTVDHHPCLDFAMEEKHRRRLLAIAKQISAENDVATASV